jgi:FkbM family methyltransferase
MKIFQKLREIGKSREKTEKAQEYMMFASKDTLSLLLDLLSEREVDKLKKLAIACGKEFDIKFVTIALKNLIKVVPASIKSSHFVPKSVQDYIESIERDDRYVVVTLKDGVLLKTFQSRQQYRNYYYCFRNDLPGYFSPESYQACHDIWFRYERGDKDIKDMIKVNLFRPADSNNIIECGAYNGWKALGYAKHLGKEGKIIVIEIDNEQYELAKFNLGQNLDEGRFIVLNTGVWNSVEERSYTYEHFASHTLKTPDEHKHHTQAKKIVTTTLDNIIDESGIDVFDFLNIQTGGSELETVQGLVRNLNRVKVMWLGTHYAHDGVSIRYRCIDYLLRQGCRIYDYNGKEIGSVAAVDKSEVGGIWAVTPEFKDTIVPTFGDMPPNANE